jgi:p-cumate 2,3-dioxygenase beta subunit
VLVPKSNKLIQEMDVTLAELDKPTMQRVLTRLAVEDFLHAEAALLDAWDIDTWLTLFLPDCQYEVLPTSVEPNPDLSSTSTLFLIGDDYERLTQRVLRMNKKTAHVEYPHSKTRHIYSNIRVLREDAESVTAAANFVTFRTKNKITTYYPGSFEVILARTESGFMIRRKRIALDLEALIPQGKVSIFL